MGYSFYVIDKSNDLVGKRRRIGGLRERGGIGKLGEQGDQ